MPGRKGLLAPQNTFLDTIATRFDGTHSNFVLGNAQVPPAFPIVYCSDGFCELTGFARAQIMQKGCACKFLYGSETEDEKKKLIETALADKTELKLEIKFYKKLGSSPFWCLLDIVPIKNEKGEVVLFLASHKDISSTKKAVRSNNTLTVPGFESESSDEEYCKLDGGGEDLEANNGGHFNLGPEAPANYNYGRRRSRAVLYQLSGHYKTDKTSKKIHSKLNANSLLSPPSTNIQPLPEYKTAVAKKPRWVLAHYGMFKTCWDVLVLLATIYVAIVVPYNAAFPEQVTFPDNCFNTSRAGHERQVRAEAFVSPNESADATADSETEHVFNGTTSVTTNSFLDDDSDTNMKSSIVMDVIVETIFIIDILLNFRTTFVNRKGEVVSSGKSIAFHYIRGWFLLDLIAALPFDLLYASHFSDMSTELHLLKLTRLLRLARLLQKMDRYSQYSIAILTLLMLTFALLAHWLACIWFVIGSVEQPDYTSDFDNLWPGWLNLLAQRLSLANGGCVPHSEAYVTALYYSCTSLTTVGFGNVSANTTWEKIFSVVIMLIGALMHATIFGNVTALVARLYGARKSLYQTKWKDLKDFTILHSVPKQLKTRMQDYFQTMWSLNHGIDPGEILMDYPEELRGDVSLHLHKEILGLPIFESASEGCKKLISLKIKTNFCAPDEFLIHKGDALQNIFYLYNGSMEVLQEGMVVAILGKGDLVGCDISKHLASTSEVVVKSSCDVRALTYCDLKCLSIPGLVDVLKLYPEFKDQFSEDIKHDLTYNLREGYDADEETICGVSVALPSMNDGSKVNTPEAAHALTNELSNLSSQVRVVLDDLKNLSSSGKVLRTAEKEVQTEFPAALLENYVKNNRKRILKLLGFTNATASAAEAVHHGGLHTSKTSLQLSDRPSSLNARMNIHASCNPLMAASPTEKSPSAASVTSRLATASKNPRRNLYVANPGGSSIDCPPTISVDHCGDDDSPTPRVSYLKRHSTGDAMELAWSSLRQQKLREAEDKNSTSSLGGKDGPKTKRTDF